MTAVFDPLAAGHGVVPVSHHQFFLTDGPHDPVAPMQSTNGLIDAAVGAAIIRTGIHTGVVRLTVEPRADAPPARLNEDWEAIVEVSLQAPAGQLRVATLIVQLAEPFPVLTPAGAGDYRVRVHARGRDTDIDGTAFEPVEDYLVQVWPAPPGPQHVYKLADRYGTELLQTQQATPPSAAPEQAGARDGQRDALLHQSLQQAQNLEGNES